jgi:hypothetical protein
LRKGKDDDDHDHNHDDDDDDDDDDNPPLSVSKKNSAKAPKDVEKASNVSSFFIL